MEASACMSSVFVVNEMLKLHLGTLFLSNYDMPALSDVQKLVDVAFAKYPVGRPFGSYVLRMTDLIDELMLFKDTLLQLGTNNFLGPFTERLKDYDNCPTSIQSSTLKFFENFFDKRQTRLNIQEMRNWCLNVVQFEEANEKRTVEAFKFLSDVKDYVEMKNAELIAKMREDAIEERQKLELKMKKTTDLKKKFEEEWKLRYERAGCDCTVEVKNVMMCKSCLAVVNYHDTKACDCYEYEVSGDCGCNSDL